MTMINRHFPSFSRTLLPATFALLGCGLACAQDKTPQQDPPPPPAISPYADDGVEPEVTITHHGEDRYEEYRVHGHLYMIKVTPRVGRPYYLVARDKDGNFERRDDLGKDYTVPQWVLLRW